MILSGRLRPRGALARRLARVMSGAMTYRTRKRLALLILVIGMPLYAVAAVTVVGLLDRPHPLIELAIYVSLGVAWVLPFRGVFRGVGRPDPGREQDDR